MEFLKYRNAGNEPHPRKDDENLRAVRQVFANHAFVFPAWDTTPYKGVRAGILPLGAGWNSRQRRLGCARGSATASPEERLASRRDRHLHGRWPQRYSGMTTDPQRQELYRQGHDAAIVKMRGCVWAPQPPLAEQARLRLARPGLGGLARAAAEQDFLAAMSSASCGGAPRRPTVFRHGGLASLSNQRQVRKFIQVLALVPV